jgi:hypothetical protein
MSELVTQSGAQEQQERKRDTHLRGAYRRLYHRCDSRGSAHRPRRQGCAAVGQVLAEIAEPSERHNLLAALSVA